MGKFIDLTGQKFGLWTVIKRVANDKRNKTQWLCKCECGNECIVSGANLRAKRTKSCGCIRKEMLLNRITKHGLRYTRLYMIWVAMKKRCYNLNDKYYRIYGAEGKIVCNEWLHSFKAFYDWSISHGYRDDLTIDRIDPKGNYEPNNCRWATAKEQANNARRNHLIEYKGKKQTISQWAEELGLEYMTLFSRICRYDWDIEKALQSKRYDRHMITYKGKTQTMKQWSEELNINYSKLKGRIYRGWDIEKAFTTP